jgi:hypothetical protein
MRILTPIAMLLLLGGVPAHADGFRKSVPAEEGGELVIKLSMGSVEIETHDEPSVQVDARATGFGSDAYEFELDGDGRNAHLTGTRGGAFPWFGFGPRVHVRVHVPEVYGANVETQGGSVEVEELGGPLRVRTSGGSIHASEVAGDLDLETTGGGIQIDESQGKVRARTLGGSIVLSEVTGNVDAETSGGSIRAHDVEGRVRAHTMGGSITVRFETSAEGELETVGGSIEVEFDERDGIEIDARTSGGRVTLEEGIDYAGRLERDRMEGAINGGGPPLRLRTTGGSIRLRGH